MTPAQNRKIIVFGSLNMDLSIECDHQPEIGETAIGRKFITNAGGKGANQAVACAKMGGIVHMIGSVGKDMNGDHMIASLNSHGVDCTKIFQVDDHPTGIAMITRIGGNNFIIVDAGANVSTNIETICEALDEVATTNDIFLTQLECDIKTTWISLHEAKSRGLFTVINPAPAKAVPDQVLATLDMIVVNETECETITGVYPENKDTAEKAAKSLQEKGVKTVVITLGERGSLVFDVDEVIESVPPKTKAIDTTCAGDTYIGALLASLSRGQTLQQSVELATKASALTTTKIGAQQSIPTLEMLER